MKNPKVAVIVGSASDLPKIESGLALLDKFRIKKEVIVASAHRTPAKVMEIAKTADKHFDLVIAGAGMAAHLPGVIASYTTLPVIGIPISSQGLGGFDSLYSIVQMPPGVPVATVAVDGAKNAAILAAQILALKYPYLKKELRNIKDQLKKKGKI
ncbi:MAG: 5-(carboxyamino)imidazole ribonucleotide mutase [Candidatus Margulisiibacteriota bacterium]